MFSPDGASLSGYSLSDVMGSVIMGLFTIDTDLLLPAYSYAVAS